MKTEFISNKDIKKNWYVIDAKGMTLGHLATKCACLLIGKNKPYFSRHQDVGDYVIVVNAGDIVLSKNSKYDTKIYYHHSLHPGGLKKTTFKKMQEQKPCYPVKEAVRRMLPKNRLGKKLFLKLKVFEGSTHTFSAQQPVELKLDIK